MGKIVCRCKSPQGAQFACEAIGDCSEGKMKALKSRLALAEKVCEAADNDYDIGEDLIEALAAWRGSKPTK